MRVVEEAVSALASTFLLRGQAYARLVENHRINVGRGARHVAGKHDYITPNSVMGRAWLRFAAIPPHSHETRCQRRGFAYEKVMEVLMARPLKLQIIENAKELIQDERHWCRGYLATDDHGLGANPTGEQAVKYCALGALIAAAYQLTNNHTSARELARNALWPLCENETLVLLNDYQGHAAVLALFEEAIAKT